MRRAILPCLALLGACVTGARAQESTFTPAATQPSVGRFITKHLITFDRYDDANDTGGTDLALTTTVSYGITRDLSATLTLPVIVRRPDAPGEDTIHDLADLRLEAKYRFWQHDPGPVDTLRLAARAGLELPTGSDGLSSEGVDPYLGVVFMSILGKHGFNQSLTYTMTTDAGRNRFGPGQSLSDVLAFDTAYLYRLAPDAYDNDTAGSLYAMVELNGAYETNGDTEIMLSPGLLWEARNYALEASIRIPVYADVDHRPEREIGFSLGIRFLF
ncbi:MAG: hypothetical protein Tsb0013_19780 [Phycisphaerales bacterium]